MKKLIGLVLLVLVTLVAVISSSGFVRQVQEPVIDSIKVENPFLMKEDKGTVSASSKPRQSLQQNATGHEDVFSTLQVSADKLFAHIQRLNFTRYTPAERSRTRAYIIKELKKLGWKPKLEKFQDGVNVFAERQGTEKDAGAILVAAHYDTVVNSPGADDNASGVAVMLEVARLLGSRSTPRTLQLAFFDREEAGLLGSKAFVTNSTHLENLRGVIVMDMVGYGCYNTGCQKYPAGLPIAPPSDKGDFLAVVGDAEHLSLLNAFAIPPTPLFKGGSEAKIPLDKEVTGGTQLPLVLTLPIPLKGLLTPDTLRSDHAPFWYQGVGAVLVTDTANLRTPHYHQPSDVPATIDRTFFTGAAQVVVNATTALLRSRDVLETPTSFSPTSSSSTNTLSVE